MRGAGHERIIEVERTREKDADVKSDSQLETEVAEQLFRDVRVDDSEISARAESGMVTLRGTVGSLGAKLSAGRVARRVAGLDAVHNDLEVRLMSEHRRDDAELRGSVLKMLSWSASIPAGVDATVKNGVVTLTGTVDHRHQRDEAEATIVNLRGVTELRDEIKVRNGGMAADVSSRIEEAFERNAEIDARAIRVEALDGTVILSGFVTSWLERNAAIDAAWTAPGVEKIDDQLGIGG